MPRPAVAIFALLLVAVSSGAVKGKGIQILSAVNANTGNQKALNPEALEPPAVELGSRRLQSTTPVSELTDDEDRKDMGLFLEPGNGTFSPNGNYVLCYKCKGRY